jgi:hypothetical protein
MRYLLLLLTLTSCALTPLEAGLVGAVAGTTTTLFLDDDPDIIVDGEQLQITGAESNAFSLLEVAIENLWSIVLICLLLWLMPSPQQLFQKWRKRIKHYAEKN